jgi:tetratricopeptide (TPR) repeat protein
MTIAPMCGRFAARFAIVWICYGLTQTLSASECATPVAQAVSIQGRVEVRTEDVSTWTPVVQNEWLCPGDHVRVGANSRAGLSLNDDTLLRLAENSIMRISAPETEGSAWLDLLEGITHIISRVRHKFQINTPYVNASIEGTEFTLQATEDGGGVTVLEGRVRATNAQGEVLISDGERALARPGEKPRVETAVDPLEAVQWALYYPPVIEPKISSPSPEVQQSFDACRRGDIEGAFSALERSTEVEQDAQLLLYRASLHLRVGGLEAARQDLDAALRMEPEHADALALMSIIATVRNEPQQALEQAQRAVETDPQAAAPYLALSYARQALFQLPEALDAAQQATRVEPENSLAWSRLANLHLMFRQLGAASDTATRAVTLACNLPQNQTTLGYAQLIKLELDAARQAFQRATAMNQADPLPRLGLGLVEIRDGNLAEGRRQIETAANLDPGNALIRSYLGKAYYEERRDKRAATQLELAKRFDDPDPTPWFYDAILKQTQNRPVEALNDLQSAIERNDNRAVYRSRLLLDEDLAARSASLARIYDELGFERLALKESWKSLASDPGNASAHRFLSDSHAGVPRHEIARVSELLQAQLLAPEIISPVSPSASETNLLAFQGSGPSLAGFNEYNPLFNRQRLAFLASGLSGSNNTRGQEIAVGGFTSRGMLSAGYFEENSDGFRENNDSDQSIKNVFAQYRINSTLSIQGEFKSKESEFGDLLLRFDPELFSTVLRRSIETDSSRIGLNYSPSVNNTFLISSSRQDLQDRVDRGTISVGVETDREQHEFQYIYQGESLDLVTGIGKAEEDEDTITTATLASPFPGFPAIVITTPSHDEYDQKSAYAYLNLSWSNGTGIIGMDYLDIESETAFDESEFNPKLGLLWDITKNSTLRLAAYRTLQGTIVNNQTLAPTQIAGFNQFFDDIFGTKAWHYGAAIDSTLTENLYAGIELTRRTPTVPAGSSSEEDQQELRHEAYLNWVLNNHFSLTGRYLFEDFEREYIDGQENLDRPAALQTQTLGLQLNYHHPIGIFGSFESDYVSQEISNVLPTTGVLTEDDSFSISNATIGMRLPKRRGIVELKVHNILDQNITYQSIHPGTGTQLTSRYYPERAFFGSLQLWFH